MTPTAGLFRYAHTLLWISVLPFAPTRAAGDADLIPREVLFSPTERLLVALSPDGSQIGYLAAEGGNRQLWIASVNRPHEAGLVTQRSKVSILSWRWSYRPGIVLLECADLTKGRRVFALDLQTEQTTELSPPGIHDDRIVKVSPAAA